MVQPTEPVEPPLTPHPTVRLCCVTVVLEIDPSSDCYIQGELQPNNQSAKVKAEFGFPRNLNTVDAYVIVKILEGDDVVILGRYLVRPSGPVLPNEIVEATESLEASGLSCSINSEDFSVELEVEPA